MTENKKLSSINYVFLKLMMGIKVQYYTPLDTVKSDVPILYYTNVNMWENACFATT